VPTANRYKAARKQSGFTQSEVESKLGFNDTTISEWETGKKVPTPSQHKKLEEFYGVKIPYSQKSAIALEPAFMSFVTAAIAHIKTLQRLKPNVGKQLDGTGLLETAEVLFASFESLLDSLPEEMQIQIRRLKGDSERNVGEVPVETDEKS